MKKLFLRTHLFLGVLAFLTSGIVLSSCKDDDEDNNSNEIRYENVVINAAQEFPPVNSAATGTFNGTYNKTSKMLMYSIVHNVSGATAAHFHEAPKDSSGAVVIPIAAPYTSITNRMATLTPAQEADLLRGRLYVNIHSPSFPTGEIRGQIPAR